MPATYQGTGRRGPLCVLPTRVGMVRITIPYEPPDGGRRVKQRALKRRRGNPQASSEHGPESVGFTPAQTGALVTSYPWS
jgi:hypothetical protein